MEAPLSPIRIDPVKNLYQPQGVSVSVLRLDAIHPLVSGNKWYKLHRYLQRARAEGRPGIITWGGPWSNHILATAAACRDAGILSAALIRGEAPGQPSATLRDAAALGMELRFISREDYRGKNIPSSLRHRFDGWLEVPEGGYGAEGRLGAGRILEGIARDQYTHMLCAVGTGTTLAGLIGATHTKVEVIGINVLKNAGAEAAVAELLPIDLHPVIHIEHGFHFGGYAKHPPELLQFMNDWYRHTGIPSDFVYTGKLFAAADALIRSGRFAAGSRLLLVHSGGLQGNRSLPDGTLIF